ncbi:hypothetical protein ACFOJ6_03255 [Gordonia humi]|uniref:hypothetical protein n=1 Tax=Gordonia humi TaxID=686429 RepID=UPI003616EF5F
MRNRTHRPPGVITVTGRPKEYGCLVHSWVRWINVSTGRTGASLTSSGLNGIPAEARLHTGAGRVALIVDPRPGTMLTPGLATIDVR